MLEMALPPPSKVQVILVSSLYPHSTADMAFAPVLIGIERNLEWLRTSDDLEFALALDLNDDDRWYHTTAERAARVGRSALRNVELHGLTVTPTEDGYGLRVSHGDYEIPIMLGKRLAEYIENGLPRARFLVPAA